MQESLKNIKIQRLSDQFHPGIGADVLRLDLVDPVISGNKWFKLRRYLDDAALNDRDLIATLGGTYSNHIVATAAAAAAKGLKSQGIIRGEEPAVLSPTLLQARSYGMELIFVSRDDYRNKERLKEKYTRPGIYWINEGGYGIPGAQGAGEILQLIDQEAYAYIFCAVGTGTTMAGLVDAAAAGIMVAGISVLKGYTDLGDDIRVLLQNKSRPFDLYHDHHFGGYAKYTPALIGFMNELWHTENLPTDIVYTGKLLYAVKHLLDNTRLAPGKRVLVIHSGGLQGNRSLVPGTLSF